MEPRTDIRTSIIVPLYNGASLTRACVQSIERAGLPGDAELVLVDNGSTDDTGSLLDELAATHIVVRSTENTNFSGGCALGVAAASGDLLVFLNNDTEVTSGWLDALIEPLSDPGVGIVGARLLYPDGTLQHGGVAFGPDAIGYHVHAGQAGTLPAALRRRTAQAVTAACVAMRHDVWRATGGFDTEYRNGMEDVDLCLRVRQLGLSVLYEPACEVVHHESKSDGRFAHAGPNTMLYLTRWQERVLADAWTWQDTGSLLVFGGECLSGTQNLVLRGDDWAAQANADLLVGTTARVSFAVSGVSTDNEVLSVSVGDCRLVVTREALEYVGGLDVAWATPQASIADLANRCLLAGFELSTDRTELHGGWLRLADGSPDAARFRRRWHAVPPVERLQASYEPFVGPRADGGLDVPTRAIPILLVAGATTSAEQFGGAARILFQGLRARTDTSIVACVPAGDEVALAALDAAADAAGEPLPDIVLVEGDAGVALALAHDVQLVVAAATSDGLAVTIARAAGRRVLLASDAVDLVSGRLDVGANPLA